MAVVVTAPGKADETRERLSIAGFEVTQRELEIDPSEMEDSEETESGSESDDELRWLLYFISSWYMIYIDQIILELGLTCPY